MTVLPFPLPKNNTQTRPVEDIGRTQELVPIAYIHKDAVVLKEEYGLLCVGLRIHSLDDRLIDTSFLMSIMESIRNIYKNFFCDFQIYIGTRQQDLTPIIQEYKDMVAEWNKKLLMLEIIKTRCGAFVEKIYTPNQQEDKKDPPNLDDIFNQIMGFHPKDLSGVPGRIASVINAVVYRKYEDEYDKEIIQQVIEKETDESIKLVHHYIKLICVRGAMFEEIRLGPSAPMRDILVIIVKSYKNIIGKLQIGTEGPVERCYEEAIMARSQFALGLRSAGFKCEEITADDLIKTTQDMYQKSTNWHIEAEITDMNQKKPWI
ncbi:MAG: hypothetical protein NZM04_09310 [Methylacidiphilales bacterium]|nr:hypothetical protein [Candidatus Methylacidiphilales bacterium]